MASDLGNAKIGDGDVSHEAVSAEDWVQAFLWRHLVRASELKALGSTPSAQPPPKRVPCARPPSAPETKLSPARQRAAGILLSVVDRLPDYQ